MWHTQHGQGCEHKVTVRDGPMVQGPGQVWGDGRPVRGGGQGTWLSHVCSAVDRVTQSVGHPEPVQLLGRPRRKCHQPVYCLCIGDALDGFDHLLSVLPRQVAQQADDIPTSILEGLQPRKDAVKLAHVLRQLFGYFPGRQRH